jgi:protein gp37
MAGKSNIEWTEDTWNPIVGCSILTPGCVRCYAMGMAARIEAMNAVARDSGKKVGAPQYDGTTKKVNGHAVWTGNLALAGDNILLQPLKRKKPTTYFVNSMGDLFHEKVPDEWIDKVFAVMALAPQHTFQVLTKRAARMRDYAAKRNGMGNAAICGAINEIPFPLGNRRGALEMPLPNVWLGVSTERQQEADERIPLLLQTPAAIRFISAEPLLGPIALHALNLATPTPSDALRGVQCVPDDSADGFHNEPMAKLDWVIVGGESGHGYRPMAAEWAYSLRDWCVATGVPVFIKQMAGKKPIPADLLVRQFPAFTAA